MTQKQNTVNLSNNPAGPSVASPADPLGQALSDYLACPSETHILVHSNITEDEKMPVAHFFRDKNSMPEIEQTALAHCHGRTLDIGAGAGSHALLLQQRDIPVTALDISPGAVAVMRQRGVADAQCTDVFDFQGDAYDTLLMLMTGIGVAGTLGGLDRLLAHAKTLLQPGGQILLDSADILYMFEDEEGGVWLDMNGPYHGEVTYRMTYNGQESQPFDWLFISFELLADYAQAAGFGCEMLCTDQSGQYLARLDLPLHRASLHRAPPGVGG